MISPILKKNLTLQGLLENGWFRFIYHFTSLIHSFWINTFYSICSPLKQCWTTWIAQKIVLNCICIISMDEWIPLTLFYNFLFSDNPGQKLLPNPSPHKQSWVFLKKYGCKHKSYPVNLVFWQAHTLSYHIIPLDKFPTDRPTQAPANSAGSGLSSLQPIYSAKPSLSGSGYLFDSPD